MSNIILQQQRRFQVWLYTTSHGCLLIRSPKSQLHLTRFDILFKNVASMCLPTIFDDILIRHGHDRTNHTVPLGALSLQDRTVYQVIGVDFEGYVAAGSVTWREDTHEYDEPSGLSF